MPIQVSGDFGGRNRFFPPVEAPYGTPLKMLRPGAVTPRKRPDAVSTIGLVLDAVATAEERKVEKAETQKSDAQRSDVRSISRRPSGELLRTSRLELFTNPRTENAQQF